MSRTAPRKMVTAKSLMVVRWPLEPEVNEPVQISSAGLRCYRSAYANCRSMRSLKTAGRGSVKSMRAP